MPKKESYQKGLTKKEVYSKLDGLKRKKGKAQYLSKILSKKGLLAPETYKAVQEVADEIYGGAAVEAVEMNDFADAGEFAEKIKDEKLADEIYRKIVMGAVQKGRGWLGYIREFSKKIKDEKLADDIYGKMAVVSAERGYLGHAIEFAEKAGNRKLVDEIYRKAAVNVIGEGEFYRAGKAEEYLKQHHPEVLADIYEETGKVIKAKDIRKRLEVKKKKK